MGVSVSEKVGLLLRVSRDYIFRQKRNNYVTLYVEKLKEITIRH